MPTTTRAGLRYPVLSDTPDVPRDLGNLAADADSVFAMYAQGTFASRPTSSGGSPGKTGRVYYSTDLGHFYYDFGTGWTDIGPTAAGIADGSVTGGPAGAGVKIAAATITHDNIAAGTITSTEITNGTIVAADISSTLLPSGGAGAGTEALRALGTAAGTAAAGTHASQHSRTGADPLVISTFVSSGLFSARPSTSLVSGQVYTATDVNGGTSYMYNGAAWVQMGLGASGSATPGAHASTHLAAGTDALAWTSIHGAGTFASRPAVGSTNAGYFYFATDTGNMYRSDGSSWTLVAASASTIGSAITFAQGSLTVGQSLTSGAGLTDVTGASVSVPATGTYLVDAGAAQVGTGQQGQPVTIQVLDNAATLGPAVSAGGFGSVPISIQFQASLTAGHTVKLQANANTPTAGSILGGFIKLTRLT